MPPILTIGNIRMSDALSAVKLLSSMMMIATVTMMVMIIATVTMMVMFNAQ